MFVWFSFLKHDKKLMEIPSFPPHNTTQQHTVEIEFTRREFKSFSLLTVDEREGVKSIGDDNEIKMWWKNGVCGDFLQLSIFPFFCRCEMWK